MYDLLLRDARIVDGTGNPWQSGDVAIIGQKIAAVGRLGRSPARRVIDASGRVVSPGFIDIHGHSDYLVLADPLAENKLWQGITTDVSGNCGFSAAPLGEVWLQEWWVENPDDRFTVVSRAAGKEVLARHGIELDWSSLGEYFARIEENGLAVNYASFVGQVALRLAVTGEYSRRPSAAELRQMKALLARAMQQGALGFSTESGSHRGMDFDLAELNELCQAAARYGGSYACHMRSYDDQMIASLKEALHTAEVARIPLILSHLMVNGLENAGKSRLVLDLIEEARDRGLQVAVDIFPYWFEEALHFSPLLSSVLPEWASDGGPVALRAAVRDPPQRARLLAELRAGKSSRAYVVPGRTEQEAYGLSPLKRLHWENSLRITACRGGEQFVGQTAAQAARALGVDPFEAILDLLALDAEARKAFVSPNEADLRALMRYPGTAFGTDGGLVRAILRAGAPSPVLYASFPHVLGHYVRREKVLSLEDAVRKMTSLPAQTLGLADRGLLRPGMQADVVMFDPDTVDGVEISDPTVGRNTAYTNPGIEVVIVNGQVALEDGAPTGARPGKILRRQARRL